MPIWNPEPIWKDQDVFIIGGGNSLRVDAFNWNLLVPEFTVGCNDAYLLGADICKVCVFGDLSWFNSHKDKLASYEGRVFTNDSHLYGVKAYPWLWTMKRTPQGLHTDALGWNENTGAVAINLALLLGTKRIFLLGYDMKRIQGKANWHDDNVRPAATKPHIYEGFARSFRYVVRDWKAKFSDREIVNVTRDSALPPSAFPWVDPDVFWKERKVA
jgi:hypothetical protein